MTNHTHYPLTIVAHPNSERQPLPYPIQPMKIFLSPQNTSFSSATIVFPMPNGARFVLCPENHKHATWRAELFHPATLPGPEGPQEVELVIPIATGLEAGDTERANTIFRHLVGKERQSLERLLAILGTALAEEAGISRIWTIDAKDNYIRMFDRHGTLYATLPLPIPGWADLPGEHLKAGCDLHPRVPIPSKDTAHGRAALRYLLCKELAALNLPENVPDLLGVAHHFKI